MVLIYGLKGEHQTEIITNLKTQQNPIREIIKKYQKNR